MELLARDKDGKVWGGRCGARLGGGGPIQGSMSFDGSRLYFTTRPGQPYPDPPVLDPFDAPPCDTDNELRILERLETPSGPTITEILPRGPPEGDDRYQGASLDGSKVFVATPRKLTASDQDASAQECSGTVGQSLGCDLYLYDADLPEGERLIQASAGGSGDPDPGKGADVLSSITALSPDGSHVYFAAQGVLTTDPNPVGATAVAGQPNLYLYERSAAHPSGRTAFIGPLDAGDQGRLWSAGTFFGGAYAVPLLGPGGGDGHVLFFLSKASLTADDADAGKTDVFRYEANTPELICVSCSAAGPDSNVEAGPLTEISPSSNMAEQGRWVSEDGETAAFATAQPLSPEDEDDVANAYLWKEGQHARLPGPVNSLQLPAVSPGGEEMGYSTNEALLTQDGDTARDIYVVRADGGFPPPPPPPICDPLTEGSCSGPPTAPPAGPGPATNVFVGPPNKVEKPKCGKGFVRKKGKCVKKKQGKAGKGAKHSRRAGR